MISDDIKLLAKRISDERPPTIQIALWLDELCKQHNAETIADAAIREEGLQWRNQLLGDTVRAVADIAEQHPECPGCAQIVEIMSIGYAGTISQALVPPDKINEGDLLLHVKWADDATEESGYTIYHSFDGVAWNKVKNNEKGDRHGKD